MSGILGFWNLDGKPVDPGIVSRMSDTLRHRGLDGEGRAMVGPVAFVQQHVWMTTEEEADRLPLISPQGAWLIIDGRIDSRDELVARLGLARDTSDAACVLAAYSAWGESFVDRLTGDFALALYDPVERRVLLARDALGIRPLYHFRNNRLFAFASEIKALLAHPEIPTVLSVDGVADFMLIGSRPLDRQDVTCFEGISALVPSHLLVATPRAVVSRRYWDFDGGRTIRLSSRNEYVEAFRERFAAAVRRRIRSRWPVAVSISGGFDSSSILCQALTLNADRPLCPAVTGISYLGTADTEADERRYLTHIERDYAIAIERFDMEPLLGVLEDAAEQVRAVEAPFLDYMWRITRHQHRRSAAQGARSFLTGHWGDQMLFSSAYLADLFARFRWSEVRRHLHEYRRYYGDEAVRVLTGLFALDAARAFLPARLLPLAKRLRRGLKRSPVTAPWFSTAFLRRGLRFAAAPVTVPLEFHSVHARSIYLEARSKYHVHCLEWNNKAAALNGLTCAFPFLDRDLIQFLMAVPGEVQNTDGVPRALAREAMRGVLPDEIRERVWKADLTALMNAGVFKDADGLRRALSEDSLVAKMGFVEGGRLNGHVEEMLMDRGQIDCVNSWRVADLWGLETWLRIFLAEGNPGEGNAWQLERAHATT